MKPQLAWIVLLLSTLSLPAADLSSIPHLEKKATVTQLIVDGKPFLILGGELHNSSSSSLVYMEPLWPELRQMNLNTVLTPVSWELIEPQEGKFDFTLVDGLIHGARKNNLHLIFLWFGSWKNCMSSYTPAWVKTNEQRFPRAQTSGGNGLEMLSPFSDTNCAADVRAFAALMKHLREMDGGKHTVIMVQVENEIGMIPEARDHSAAADQAFSGPVPQELIDYLEQHHNILVPQLRQQWEDNGSKTSGTWEQVFGSSPETEEIFMAWYYARYTDRVAAAGKAEYPLPMYVNAALNRPHMKPGQYSSGGPLPEVFDVWHAGAPHIDIGSPDIYFPNFADWCEQYHRPGNPLFIPEMRPFPANLLYAIGQFDAIGVSPFGIEDEFSAHHDNLPSIAQTYKTLSELAPLILENQGRGVMTGVWLDQSNQVQTVKLGNYTLKVAHDYTWAYSSGYGQTNNWPRLGGLIIATAPDEYIIAGTGLVVTFASNSSDKTAGILSIDEDNYVNDRWVPGRRLNGDENHQGRHVSLPLDQCSVQRVKLYSYH